MCTCTQNFADLNVIHISMGNNHSKLCNFVATFSWIYLVISQVLFKCKALILYHLSEELFLLSMGTYTLTTGHLKCFKQLHLHIISFNIELIAKIINARQISEIENSFFKVSINLNRNHYKAKYSPLNTSKLPVFQSHLCTRIIANKFYIVPNIHCS